MPSLLVTYNLSSADNAFEIFVALLYPIADAFLIVPALIGLILFFKGRRNYFWLLIVIGILTLVAADAIFLYTIISDSYTGGHPVDILWVAGYTVFIFALYDFIISRKSPMKLFLSDTESSAATSFSTIIRVLIPLTVITIATVVLLAVFSIDFTNDPEKEMGYLYTLVYGIFAIIGIFSFIVILINRSLTKLVKMRTAELEENHKKLLQKERMSAIGELSSHLAHDLRNPLSIIKNSNKFLEMYMEKDNPNVTKNFQMIDRAISRMAHQIEGVLEFVKSRPLVLKKESILEIINSASQMFKIPSNITILYPKNDVICKCDFQKIEVIITNLIMNSIQAIGKNDGQIEISLNESKKSILLKVRDSDPGIVQQDLKKIFDPLYTTKLVGTGLGLASCKNLIEQHGGTIDVRINPTVFSIKLPRLYDIQLEQTLSRM